MDKCVYVMHLFYMCVHACTHVYMRGLMPRVFCFCTRGTHTCVVQVVGDLYRTILLQSVAQVFIFSSNFSPWTLNEIGNYNET